MAQDLSTGDALLLVMEQAITAIAKPGASMALSLISYRYDDSVLKTSWSIDARHASKTASY